MTENISPNKYSSINSKRKPRFSLPANKATIRRVRASPSLLLNRSSESSATNSPMSSSDGEWARFQAELGASKAQAIEFDSDDSIDEEFEEVARTLSFNSPEKKRMSIGTLNNQKKEIELMKRDMALDDEANELIEQRNELEESFRIMFAEVTSQRIAQEMAAKGKEADTSKIYELVNSIDLRDVDYVNWATTIEKAIETYMD